MSDSMAILQAQLNDLEKRLVLPLGLTLSVSGLIAQSSSSAPPRKILFVGDSFTYTQGGIYTHFEKLAASAQPPLVISTDKAVAGGAFLKVLWQLKEPVTKIDTGSFEVVVLQDDIPETNVDYFRQYARMFVDEVRKNKGPQKAHRDLAKELNVEVAPVGLAWEMAAKERPSMDFYAGDREHPSIFGTYLATCVIYATIYNRDPSGLTYAPSGVTREQATFLQRIAWQTAQDYRAGRI